MVAAVAPIQEQGLLVLAQPIKEVLVVRLRVRPTTVAVVAVVDHLLQVKQHRQQPAVRVETVLQVLSPVLALLGAVAAVAVLIRGRNHARVALVAVEAAALEVKSTKAQALMPQSIRAAVVEVLHLAEQAAQAVPALSSSNTPTPTPRHSPLA